MYNHPSGYKVCPACGVAVRRARLEANDHECAPEQFVKHQMMLARSQVDRFEADFELWLTTPDGRFQLFLALRD